MASYHAISNSDIIRAGAGLAGATLRVNVQGVRHRIRSDFPVEISFDGKRRAIVGGDTDAYRPNLSSPSFVFEGWCKEITLRLMPGFGAAGINEAKGWYGLCVIESEDDLAFRQDPTDPRLLSPHCYTFIEDSGVTQASITQADFPIAEWLINGRLPSEFYLTQVSCHRRDTEIAGANYQLMEATSEVTCFRQAVTGGDREDLWSAAGTGPAWCASFPFLKMPLAALMGGWQAGDVTYLSFEYTQFRSAHMQSQIIMKLSGTVRW
jgi:hypothetical protein